jgi:hypothetical protein
LSPWDSEVGLGIGLPGTFLSGEIAEVMIYNSAITASQLDGVGAYLTEKYGLAWAPAS